jgi:hypothetical protein
MCDRDLLEKIEAEVQALSRQVTMVASQGANLSVRLEAIAGTVATMVDQLQAILKLLDKPVGISVTASPPEPRK